MDDRPAGYAYLLKKFGISGMPNWHSSFILATGTHRSQVQEGLIEEVYSATYWPGDNVGDHLEFALKYDGVNLGLLKQIFDNVPQDEILNYIKSKPTGKYARRIWFFYEYLTDQLLPIDDVTQGNYVEALDPKQYYTVESGQKSKRHRIVDNLLGNKQFNPVARKRDQLKKMETVDLRKKCDDLVASYPPEILRRALAYLYRKETKSSFEIEHV